MDAGLKVLKPVISFQPQNMLDVIHYKKFPFTELQGNHVPKRLNGITVMNQTRPKQTSHLILLILTFVLSSNQYGAVQPVQ